jgi:hypothetical protein
MVNSRRKRLEREIDRDSRMTTSGYVHEVMAATLGQLQRASLADRCPDPVALFDEVDAITRKFRSFHRRLNDERINRRGARDRHAAPTAELPPAVRPFAYHGAYLGAFPSVEAFAHACLDPAKPEEWSAYVDLTQAGIDLHLSGRYWTLDADGVTHAFALAPERARDSPAAGNLAHGLRGAKRRAPIEPPRPDHAPARALAAMQGAGCDASIITEMMPHYVAHYVQLADHAWYYLRRVGIPGWLLARTDLAAMVDDWCEAGVLAWVADPDGGVHVFALGDPLASDR